MTITIKQLEYFDQVAELGSITAAAKSLLISQSAVSTAIAELESELGVKLFVRHAKGLTLSPEGITILRHARSTLSGINDLQAAARHLGDSVSGALRIGCYATLSPRFVPAIVEYMWTQFPDLRLHFFEGNRTELIEGLQRGVYDVIVIYNYSFEPGLNDIGTVQNLTQIRPYALLPRTHPFAQAASVKLADLISDHFILFELEPAARYFLSLFDELKLSPSVWFRTGSIEVIRGLVARGLGYSILTQYSDSHLSQDGNEFAQVLLEEDFSPLPVVAVVGHGNEQKAKIRAFIESASRVYREDDE